MRLGRCRSPSPAGARRLTVTPGRSHDQLFCRGPWGACGLQISLGSHPRRQAQSASELRMPPVPGERAPPAVSGCALPAGPVFLEKRSAVVAKQLRACRGQVPHREGNTGTYEAGTHAPGQTVNL